MSFWAALGYGPISSGPRCPPIGPVGQLLKYPPITHRPRTELRVLTLPRHYNRPHGEKDILDGLHPARSRGRCPASFLVGLRRHHPDSFCGMVGRLPQRLVLGDGGINERYALVTSTINSHFGHPLASPTGWSRMLADGVAFCPSETEEAPTPPIRGCRALYADYPPALEAWQRKGTYCFTATHW